MNKKVGEKIRQLRAVKGLSQDNIAEEIGMSPGNFGKIERGEIDVSSTNLIEIAKVLKVSVSELFEEKGNIKEIKPDYGFATKDDLVSLTNTVKALAKEIERLREQLPQKKAAAKKKYGSK